MPPVRVKVTFSAFAGALLDRDRPDRADRRDVEGEGVGRTDVRLAEAAEQHPEHGVDVSHGPDRRAGVGTHPLLVDDDRGRQPFEDVDFGPGQRRHESLQERAVGLVDQPLRLRRDGAEHQRRLARSRDAGEHRQPPLGELDADVLQVVLPGALDADEIVGICRVLEGGMSRSCHPVSIRFTSNTVTSSSLNRGSTSALRLDIVRARSVSSARYRLSSGLSPGIESGSPSV